jgi:hypothetical protein
VSRLSSIEVIPSETTSPLAKVVLKIKTSGNKETETTINIPKDKLNELLTGFFNLLFSLFYIKTAVLNINIISELKNVRTLMEQVLQ